MDYKSTSVPIRINNYPNMSILLDFDGLRTLSDGDIVIKIKNDTSTSFSYLGHSDSDIVTANDVRYNNMGTFYDISGKEENLRTKYGAIIYDPEASQTSDSLKFAIPGDIKDYKATLRVARPKP